MGDVLHIESHEVKSDLQGMGFDSVEKLKKFISKEEEKQGGRVLVMCDEIYGRDGLFGYLVKRVLLVDKETKEDE